MNISTIGGAKQGAWLRDLSPDDFERPVWRYQSIPPLRDELNKLPRRRPGKIHQIDRR